jgi:hypothetical protein
MAYVGHNCDATAGGFLSGMEKRFNLKFPTRSPGANFISLEVCEKEQGPPQKWQALCTDLENSAEYRFIKSGPGG